MPSITLEDIRKDPQAFLERVMAGETLQIVQAEMPVAEVRPVAPKHLEPRPFGLCKGEFLVPDDFDAPLPEEILQQFENA
jgi:antitoxin (DNA-binding transcriptional repressor) of toxin-antitoxin stability system